jgi:hypothetical protein
MGLDKRGQALAALTHLAVQGQRQFLVVCPASVQINWLNEIAKHTRLDGHSLHGADRDAASGRCLRHGGVGVRGCFRAPPWLSFDDEGVPIDQRIVLAERHRLGIE